VLEKIGSEAGLFRANRWRDIYLLTRLAPACGQSQIDSQIRRCMLREGYEAERMIHACVQFASPEMQKELLDWTLRSDAPDNRMLAAVAAKVPPELKARALDRAASLPDIAERVTAVDALLPLLSEQDRVRAVRQVYRLALEIHDEPFQLIALAALGQAPFATEQTDTMPNWAAMLEQTSVAVHRAISSCLIALLPHAMSEWPRQNCWKD